MFYFTDYLFSLNFVGIAFAETVFVTSIISSLVITESHIIIYNYLPFSEVHLLGFQI